MFLAAQSYLPPFAALHGCVDVASAHVLVLSATVPVRAGGSRCTGDRVDVAHDDDAVLAADRHPRHHGVTDTFRAIRGTWRYKRSRRGTI